MTILIIICIRIGEKALSIYPHSFSFIWIPVHNNIAHNVLADMAVKKAATNNCTYKIHLSSLNDTFRIVME